MTASEWSLRSRLEELARREPDRAAVDDDDSRLSFAELERAWRQVGQSLGSRPQVVMFAVPGGCRLTALQLGTMFAGSVAVLIPETATAHEWAKYTEAVDPDRVVVATAEAGASVKEGVRCPVSTADDLLRGAELPSVSPRRRDSLLGAAMVQFTSGSTGAPKALVITGDQIEANFTQSSAFLDARARTSVLLAVPQFHAMGNAVVLEHLWAGNTVHIGERFSPGDHVRRLQAHRVRLLAASPNYFSMLGSSLTPKRTPDLQEMLMGSAAVTPSVVARVRKANPGAAIHIRYGQSEAVGTLTQLELPPETALEQAGEVGRPLPGVEIKEPLPGEEASDPEELCVRAGSVAAGRLQPDGSLAPLVEGDGGWLLTGDLAVRRGDGRLVLRGRRSEFLKSNGHRINPFEVEAWLSQHPDVAEVVVVGIPDPMAGEKVAAVVKPSASDADVAALRAHCQEGLSPMKRPQKIVVAEAIPRTPAGKPDRTAVRSMLKS
jgi:acyl-CoA synthetase (AMP-forming)/AMP-acid ligase II